MVKFSLADALVGRRVGWHDDRFLGVSVVRLVNACLLWRAGGFY